MADEREISTRTGPWKDPNATSSRPTDERHGAPSATIPDYALIKRIGGGGFGDVYLAQNRLDRHFCALKVIRNSAESELEGIRRFKACVAEHHGLVPIGHVGRAGEYTYCVMLLADHALGEGHLHEPMDYEPMTLSRRLRRVGRSADATEVAEIGRSLASGLAHMHARGAVHGDVKPDNVLRVGGRWRLGDYGLVSDADRPRPRGCTPAFVAPEGPGTPESDAFSLGKTLQCLLADPGEPDREQSTEDKTLTVLRPACEVARVVCRLIDADPARRCTVREAAAAFDKLGRTSASADVRGEVVRWTGVRVLMAASWLLGGLLPAILLLMQYPPALPSITVIAGLVFAIVGTTTVMFGDRRGSVSNRSILGASLGAVICWCTYAVCWNLLTVRTPVDWEVERPRVYQIGFGMAPWTFTDEAAAKMARVPVDLSDPQDVMHAFAAWDGMDKVLSVWAPWSVIAAGTLVVAAFGLGIGLWSAACVGLAGRALSPSISGARGS